MVHWYSARGPALRWLRLFLVFTYIWQEVVAKIPKVPRAPSNDIIVRGGVEDTRLKAKDTKKTEAKAKDSLSEDRHSRDQEQECSRPRPRTKDTSASALQNKNKKKVFTKIFQAISTKKRFQKIFQPLHKILAIQKIMLSSSRGQANFRGLEASSPQRWSRGHKSWPRAFLSLASRVSVLEKAVLGLGLGFFLCPWP